MSEDPQAITTEALRAFEPAGPTITATCLTCFVMFYDGANDVHEVLRAQAAHICKVH